MKYFLSLLVFFNSFITFGQTYSQAPKHNVGVYPSKNFIINSDFEVGLTASTYITDANSISSRSTSSPLEGKASLLIDAATSGHLVQLKTNALDAMTAGGNCQAIYYVSGDASLYKTAVFLSTTNLTGAYLQLENVISGSKKVSLFFPCGSSGDQPVIEIQATSNSAAAIKVDGVYLGKCIDCGNASVLKYLGSYTPTVGAGFGTVTSNTANYWRSGDKLIVVGSFTTGTVTTSSGTISLPGSYTIDSTKLSITGNTSSAVGTKIGDWSADTANQWGSIVTAPGTSTTLVYFSQGQGGTNPLIPTASVSTNAITNNSDPVSYRFEVPISSWSDTNTVTLDQTNFEWTSGGTITITGTTSNPSKGTTATDRILYKREGDSMKVRIEYRQTAGGSAGSGDYLFAIPSGYSIDTNKVKAYSTVEGGTSTWLADNTVGTALVGTNAFSTVATCSVVVYDSTNVRFFCNDHTAPGVPGSSWYDMGSSTTLSYTADFSVPISGWTQNQNVPLLVGSVSSGHSGADRLVRARVADSCTSTPCTIASQSGSDISSITRSSTGVYVVNFTSGTWSAAPACMLSSEKASSPSYCKIDGSSGTSSFTINCIGTSSTSLLDSGFGILCMGPR